MGQAHFSCQLAQQKIALGIIDQRKIRPQSHETSIGTQNIGAEGVEGTDRGHTSRSRATGWVMTMQYQL